MRTLTILLSAALLALAATQKPAAADGEFRYLVEFAEPGALHAVPRAPGARFDASSAEATAYLAQLQLEQAAHLAAISDAIGRAPTVTHRYLVTHSGLAAWMTPLEAALVRALPGVVAVERERIDTVATFRGPTFINADRIWDGSATPDGTGTRGLGMVIGVLDTGVDLGHPSFADDATCGHGAGGAPAKLLSAVDCATTGLDGRCDGPLPEDTQGHGSHVASTAAGNRLDGDTDPPPLPYDEISGVAPCASIRSYKTCPDLLCPGSMTMAGMNNVLLDGDVDAMNYSISGGRSPWTDNDRRKLDLVDAGVLVAAAAGNSGIDNPETVGRVNHLGPWVFTIAASTHDGFGSNVPTLAVSGPGVPPAGLSSLPMIKGSAEAGSVPDGDPFTGKPIRRFDDPLGDLAEGCAPFPPGFFDGAVALIKRGTCAFAHKVANAEAAGAEMTIIRNDEPGELAAWNAGAPGKPAYSLSEADGEAVAAWIAQHPDDAVVDFDFVPATAEGGDVLAGFSLRGPTPAPLQNLQKPDITAPGVTIFAAEPDLFGLMDPYGFKSGTSMATPHAAGAAALVRALHPDWTAPETKSAIMMTGSRAGTRPDAVTPWDADDVGSGRVDLSRAALAGLVLDEVFANFLAANPAAGGDVRTLNLPAVRDMGCTPRCTFTRTVRNTLTGPSSWTAGGGNDAMVIDVSPSSFDFSGDTSETRQLTITVTPVGDQTAAIAFGEIVLAETGARSPALHLTAAIRGSGDGTGPGEPPVTTEIDDADPAIEYRKGWHRRDDANASNGGYHRRMGNAGGGEAPSARLVFEGDRITYFYGVSEQGGSADVFVNGVLAATVDYSGAAPGSSPEFGHSVSFDGLGDGTHEFLLVFRSGAVYVDGFEIESGEGGGADASAATTSTSTAQSAPKLSLLGVAVSTVEVGADDEWLSVVVEGDGVSATLVDGLGSVTAVGSTLLPGSTAVGIDLVPPAPGIYSVQVTGTAGTTADVSVARTTALD